MTGFKRRLASHPNLLAHAFKAMRFGLVGLASGLMFILVTHYLVSFLGVDPKIAAVFGYCAAIPFNFVANRCFSFRSSGSTLPEAIRFLVMHGVGIAGAYGLMVVFVDLLGWSHLLPAAFAVFVVPVLNFFILNTWVFVRQRQ